MKRGLPFPWLAVSQWIQRSKEESVKRRILLGALVVLVATTLALEPELLSIAGVYRTSEVPLPPDVRGKPGQVRLVGGADGKLVMDPIK